MENKTETNIMNTKHIKCPSCGAGKDIYNPGIVSTVCEYCGTAIYWDDKDVMSAGVQAILPEGFSRLYRGATGSLQKKRFVVVGRVRYSFGKGFWDEWFLDFEDGTIGWLTEDNHEYSLQRISESRDIPSIENLSPGQKLMVGGVDFQVHENGEAECIGVEGDLAKKIQSKEKYHFVDASSPDGKYVLGIEYDNNPPTIFLGKWLKYSDLKLDDEGLDW